MIEPFFIINFMKLKLFNCLVIHWTLLLECLCNIFTQYFESEGKKSYIMDINELWLDIWHQ